MKTKHIVIVTPYYAPAWSYGGPPKVLSTLAELLHDKGYQVNVITSDSLGEKRSKKGFELRNGVRVNRFSTISNPLSYNYKLFYIPKLWEQTQHILTKADLVLFSDVRSLLSWQLFPNLLEQKIPYGIFLFGQVERGSEGLKSWLKLIFDLLWVRKYIQKATWLFAQTDHEAKITTSILGAAPETIHLSLLPIPPLPQVTKSQRLLFRKQHGIKETDKVILFVGRLHYLKGVDLLINAVSHLQKARKNLKLIIVGRDDGVEKELRKQVSPTLISRIIFTGPLYEADARAAYSASDIFVFTPRFYEETSTASLEALAMGIPVITTKQAEVPYLEQYKAGVIITNSKINIARAISKMLDENNANVRSRNARRLIKEKYLSIKVAEQLLNALELES